MKIEKKRFVLYFMGKEKEKGDTLYEESFGH